MSDTKMTVERLMEIKKELDDNAYKLETVTLSFTSAEVRQVIDTALALYADNERRIKWLAECEVENAKLQAEVDRLKNQPCTCDRCIGIPQDGKEE